MFCCDMCPEHLQHFPQYMSSNFFLEPFEVVSVTVFSLDCPLRIGDMKTAAGYLLLVDQLCLILKDQLRSSNRLVDGRSNVVALYMYGGGIKTYNNEGGSPSATSGCILGFDGRQALAR